MKTKKKLIVCLLSLILGFVIAAFSFVAYAYFSKKEIYDGYISGQVELLFDRLNDDGLAAYSAAEGVAADKTAEWGTEANPYVISNARHLYNLSELQNIGYFTRKHLSSNTETDLSNIPYFLISTPDYTPVLVDGSNFRAISPIGNDEHPFIGSIKGVTGSPTLTVGDNVCDTSVIHGISIKGNPKNADAGLFGHIGFLGTPPAEGSDDMTFLGTPSVVSNMVLSDVTVSVDSSLWDSVEAFIADIILDVTGHRYSYTDLYDESDTTAYYSVPHENHHIGILAGHVSYSTVEYISVFYSSGDVVAIDLSDVTDIDKDDSADANYLSAAGILGFIYNLNPSVDELNGRITAGSGDSIGDLSYSMIGGGGLHSGEKPGYVLASSMYRTYGYTAANTPIQENSALKISAATDVNGDPLCKEWIRDRLFGLGSVATGQYYFYDGVFTFALSDENDIIESTWNGEIPEFALGENSNSAWNTNNSEGNKSVSAYIKQIKSDKDLQDAIDAGIPLVIMKEMDDSSVFLMSLYNQSTDSKDGNFNERYTTNGTKKKYATDEEIAALIESFVDGSAESRAEFVEGFGEGVDTARVQQIVDLLQNDEDDETWRVINLNATSGNLTTEQLQAEVAKLRLEYKVLSNNIDGVYSYFSGNTPVTVNGVKVDDYYDYSTSGYSGYFTYAEYSYIFWTRYAYYWIPIDGGDPVPLDEESSDAPNRFFSSSGTTKWNGENVYTRQNTAYEGVLINAENGRFYSTNNTSNASGTSLTKPTGVSLNFFFRLPGSDSYYFSTDTEMQNPIPVSSLVNTGDVSGANLPIYSDGVNQGILLDRYYVYDFYSDGIDSNNNQSENHLRMIKATVPTVWKIPIIGEVVISRRTEYTLWNGSDSAATNEGNFKIGDETNVSDLSNSTNAIVKFNTDGTCYIQYAIGGATQYVNFNGSAFNTALSSTDGTRLYIYTLEATQAVNYGRITFDPKEGTDNHTFKADSYVFWPESSSVEVANGETKSSVSGVNTQYSVISLKSLNWSNGNNLDNDGELYGKNLTKKFHMVDGISFGLTLDLWGTAGTDGIIRAPVGTAGTETDIPSGCVAFRVNKSSTEAQKIRVIIAVPASECYIGEEGYELGDYERYFCLWEMPEAGDNWINVFRSSSFVERFAIPRSHFYEPGTYVDSENSEFVTATYDNKEYRAYLNGDRVLLAYEFKVYKEGVYILGTSTGSSDASDFEDRDVAPMEIVYFSVDGVASTGRDGLSGSQLGTVDYVYSYNNRIIPVTERSSTDSNGNEDYSTFYPSYCILYMNSVVDPTVGNFVNINSEKVYIRRYITDEKTPTSSEGYTTTTSRAIISFSLERDKYTRLSQYSRIADNVKKDE